MKYVYPAIFKEENNKILVSFPDLSGCHTFGNDLVDAIDMARDASAMWLSIAEDKNEKIPLPSKNILTDEGFVSFIDIDTIQYRRATNNKAVKKTLSIPSWLNSQAELADINFSAVLQNALKEQLGLN